MKVVITLDAYAEDTGFLSYSVKNVSGHPIRIIGPETNNTVFLAVPDNVPTHQGPTEEELYDVKKGYVVSLEKGESADLKINLYDRFRMYDLDGTVVPCYLYYTDYPGSRAATGISHKSGIDKVGKCLSPFFWVELRLGRIVATW